MMSKAAQIMRVTSALAGACEAHPDQRVGQVLSNAMQGSRHLFYASCDDIIQALEDYVLDRC